MLNLPRDDADTPFDPFDVLQQLDAAVVNHNHWSKKVHRTLICEDQGVAEADLATDAHHQCDFGQWFYETADPELREEDDFQEIGLIHERMHDGARALMEKRKRGEAIHSDEYDAFMDRAIEFRLAMRAFQYRFMEEGSAVDSLTGAWNRHALFLQLDQEHGRLAQAGGTSAVAMLEVDDLDGIRERHGDVVADRALRAVTGYLADGLRKFDAIYRYGPSELVLCLPSTAVEAAGELLDELRTGLAGLNIPGEAAGGPLTVTASVGVSTLQEGKPLAETLAEADYALGAARQRGRNRVCLWGEECG